MKNEESPTRELEAPRTDIGNGLHVSHENGYYKINNVDCPITLLDKQQRPFERNYKTKKEIEEIQKRVRALELEH